MSINGNERGIEVSNGRSLAKWMLVGVLVGWAVALFLLALPAELRYSLSRLRFVIWPSSVIMLSTAGVEHSVQAYLVVGVAIALNGLLYGVLGALAWLALRFLWRPPRPKQ